MSQEAQAVDEKSQWAQATSKNGNVYHVSGFPITVFSLDVHWPVDDTAHNTSPEFRAKTGIRSYTITKQTGPFRIFDYRLDFISEQVLNYEFTDESPDTYSKSVWDTNTNHSFGYNSDRPTIVHIRGFYYQNDRPNPK